VWCGVVCGVCVVCVWCGVGWGGGGGCVWGVGWGGGGGGGVGGVGLSSEGACERTPAAGFVSLHRCSGIEILPAARSSKESQRRNPPASDEAT